MARRYGEQSSSRRPSPDTAQGSTRYGSRPHTVSLAGSSDPNRTRREPPIGVNTRRSDTGEARPFASGRAPRSSRPRVGRPAPSLRQGSTRRRRAASSMLGRPAPRRASAYGILGSSRRRPSSRRYSARSNATYLRRSRRPVRRQRRRIWPFVVAAALLTVLVVGARALLFPHGEAGLKPEAEIPLLDMSAVSPEYAPRSTQRADWEKGTLPHLYQKDPVWSDQPYAGGTVGVNACGPTCLTMAYVYLTGDTTYNPPAMAQWSDDNGYSVDGMTAWALMDEGARRLGLQSEQIGATTAHIKSVIDEGGIIVANMRPGDFTLVGHFLLITDIDDRGLLSIADPNSPYRSSRKWKASQVLSQCEGLWAITA